jgi:hypothetical protein
LEQDEAKNPLIKKAKEKGYEHMSLHGNAEILEKNLPKYSIPYKRC